MDVPDLPNPAATPDADEPPERERSASGEANGSSFRYRLQLITNFVTLLVAVSAIGLSVWEGCEMRRHNRLAVLPNLESGGQVEQLQAGAALSIAGQERTLEEATYVTRRFILNTGLGPAVVHKALVFQAGAPEGADPVFETDEEDEALNLYSVDALEADIDALDRTSLVLGPITQGAMLQAGNEWPFLEIAVPASSVPDSVRGMDQVRDLIAQYSFVICYCSVYGEDCDQEHIGADPPSDAVCDF